MRDWHLVAQCTCALSLWANARTGVDGVQMVHPQSKQTGCTGRLHVSPMCKQHHNVNPCHDPKCATPAEVMCTSTDQWRLWEIKVVTTILVTPQKARGRCKMGNTLSVVSQLIVQSMTAQCITSNCSHRDSCVIIPHSDRVWGMTLSVSVGSFQWNLLCIMSCPMSSLNAEALTKHFLITRVGKKCNPSASFIGNSLMTAQNYVSVHAKKNSICDTPSENTHWTHTLVILFWCESIPLFKKCTVHWDCTKVRNLLGCECFGSSCFVFVGLLRWAPKIVWLFQGLGSVQKLCRIHRTSNTKPDNCHGWPHHHHDEFHVGVPQIVQFFWGLGSVQNFCGIHRTLFLNPTTVLVHHIIIIHQLACPKIVWPFQGLGSAQKLCGILRTPNSKSDNCQGWPHNCLLVCPKNCLTFLKAKFSTKTLWNPHNPHFQFQQLSWLTTSSSFVGVPQKCLTFSRAQFSAKTLWNPQNPHFWIQQLSWFTTSSLVGVPQKLFDFSEGVVQCKNSVEPT